jgi:hypothetical protein
MIKLFVTDVDGTLIPDGVSQINPKYYEIVKKLKEKGVLFGVASGRQYKSIERVFEPIKDDIIYIAENGAFAIYQGQELFHEPMTKEDSEQIVKDTRAMPGCQCLYDTRHMAYFEKGGEEVYHLMKDEYHYDCCLVDDLLELEEPCLKYSVYRATQIEEVTAREFNPKWSKTHQVACGGTRFMDLMRKDVSKGTALIKIQNILGITKKETLAFGDNINDLEMLQQAKYSFAIGNARQEVKDIADYVAQDNRHEGVLRVLEEVWKSIETGEEIELGFQQYKKLTR